MQWWQQLASLHLVLPVKQEVFHHLTYFSIVTYNIIRTHHEFPTYQCQYSTKSNICCLQHLTKHSYNFLTKQHWIRDELNCSSIEWLRVAFTSTASPCSRSVACPSVDSSSFAFLFAYTNQTKLTIFFQEQLKRTLKSTYS